jgi:hypothetical protein
MRSAGTNTMAKGKMPTYGTGKGSNPAGNSGGNACKSLPQHPIPGPSSPGQPPAMKKALAKKQVSDKGSSFPGLVR